MTEQVFHTGAQRDSEEGKPHPELISPIAMKREARVMEEGARMYGKLNWRAGMPFSRVIASLLRHVIAYQLGDETEDHLACIRCNAAFLMDYEEGIRTGRLEGDLDDREEHYW